MNRRSAFSPPVEPKAETPSPDAATEEKNTTDKTSMEYLMSPVVSTLNDVNVRLIDCDDENVTWRHRIDLASDAIGDVSDNCDGLLRQCEKSARAYKLLLSENQRLQDRVDAANHMVEVATRHRFVPDVGDCKPGYMVRRLTASLPPSSFD